MMYMFVIACMFMIFAFVLIMKFLIDDREYKRRLLTASEETINKQAVIDDTIPALLDSFIKDCFNDYMMLIVTPKQEAYIGEEREAEIRQDLIAKVVERISPAMMDKLSLYYNIDTIDRVIGDKIYIIVTDFIVNTNSIKDNLSDIPRG